MKRLVLLGVLVAAATIVYYFAWAGPSTPNTILLTGIVTTDDTRVASQVGGRIEQLEVREGDHVEAGQVIALLASDELSAERNYYAFSAAGAASEVEESEAELRFLIEETANEVAEAQANMAAARADYEAAVAALEDATINLDRTRELVESDIASQAALDRARTEHEAALARVTAAERRVDADRAAVARAEANAEQVEARRLRTETARQQRAAAAAQEDLASVRLSYTEVRAPSNGIVDVRAVREGEVVAAGQTIVTLIDPDDLWIRADVEETYIERVRPGDHLVVRLPSGEEREGTVFYRAVDAGFATQRDVSRTKRDIRTFEIRLRIDNADRRLAVGMTAYVLFPIDGSQR